MYGFIITTYLIVGKCTTYYEELTIDLVILYIADFYISGISGGFQGFLENSQLLAITYYYNTAIRVMNIINSPVLQVSHHVLY